MNIEVFRYMGAHVENALRRMPAVALLGPRQCGKSTLARSYTKDRTDVLYLDLERPTDLARLRDPEALFASNTDKLICIDEIQRAPELFSVLRYTIDHRGGMGQFLILGSASKELIQQSSETLAGRIRYLELTPFLWREVGDRCALRDYWLRGGFPRSWLAVDDSESFEWRLDFLRDFLERDVPMLKRRVAPSSVERLWRMLAHVHGQTLHIAGLAGSLGVDGHTVRGYVDLLEGAFMARRLSPYAANLKKRLVKTPKIYLRDTGVLHTLLGVETWNDLLGHPGLGSSWEGLCIENILAQTHRSIRASFYRTARGAEIDLVLERGEERMAVEFKASTAPKPERGFWQAVEDLAITRAWIVAPVDTGFPLRHARVASLSEFLSSKENEDFFVPTNPISA